MKKKATSKTKVKYLNEFRDHKIDTKNKYGQKKKIKHPAYIWQSRGNLFDYHSITHTNAREMNKKNPNVKLRELTKNPNPKDNRRSYYDTMSKSDIKSNFGRPHKKWKISESDKAKLHKKR